MSARDDLGLVDTHTARLLATVRGLDAGSLGEPSLCPGWSRGHVLTHVARNADALTRLVDNVLTGSTTPMYDSPSGRDAEIEAGAGRPLDEQLTDLRTSADRFAAEAARLGDAQADVQVEARNGVLVRGGVLPFMRLREVVYHHVDLGAGFSFADVDPDLTLRFLEDQVARLRRDPATPSMTIRTDEGDAWSVGDGVPTVSGPRTAVLAWLARGDTAGLVGRAPALPFGG